MASRILGLLTGGLIVSAALHAGAVGAQLGPQTVVRQFCEADALGRRVTIQGWSRVAPLVEWPLEPAWDHAFLITSYTVGWPVPADEDTLTIEVRYAVMQEVTAEEVKDLGRIDSVTFKVRASEGANWRIVGPPPSPYLFQQQVDAEALRRSLGQGGMNFIPDSLFVAGMLRAAGWDVPPLPTAKLLSNDIYRAVKEPRAGDLVVWLRDGIPYHSGLLDRDEMVVSSTLNAGLMRTTLDAFAGDVKALRLVRRPAVPAVEENNGDGDAAPQHFPEVTGPLRNPTPTGTLQRTATRQKPPAKPKKKSAVKKSAVKK